MTRYRQGSTMDRSPAVPCLVSYFADRSCTIGRAPCPTLPCLMPCQPLLYHRTFPCRTLPCWLPAGRSVVSHNSLPPIIWSRHLRGTHNTRQSPVLICFVYGQSNYEVEHSRHRRSVAPFRTRRFHSDFHTPVQGWGAWNTAANEVLKTWWRLIQLFSNLKLSIKKIRMIMVMIW